MPSVVDLTSLKNEYLVITRCRRFYSWPNHQTVFATPWQRVSISEGSIEKEAFLRYQIGTPYSPVLWTLDYSASNYPVTDRIVLPGGTTKTTPPKGIALECGMIDFAICVRFDFTMSASDCTVVLVPKLEYFVAFVASYTEDTVLPVVSNFPLEILHQPDGKIHTRTLEQKAFVDIRETRELKKEEVTDMIGMFMSRECLPGSDEERERVRVASRRYHSAIIENDLVDRFCDLWEACEFMAPRKSRQVKGKLSERISYDLANQLSISKADLENRYIKPYYDLRNDIVHNAVELPDKIREAVKVLEVLAAQMIRGRLGLGVQRRGTLREFLGKFKKGAE